MIPKFIYRYEIDVLFKQFICFVVQKDPTTFPNRNPLMAKKNLETTKNIRKKFEADNYFQKKSTDYFRISKELVAEPCFSFENTKVFFPLLLSIKVPPIKVMLGI